MGSLEAIPTHRDHLPAIDCLGKDRPGFSLAHFATRSTRSPTPLVSPTNMFSGQPLPYSYNPSVHNAGPPPGYISPPESRRAAEDEKEKNTQSQSLPPIHEALRNEDGLPYPGPPAHQTHAPPRPLSCSLGRPSGEAPSGPPNPFSVGSSSGPLFRDSGFQQPPAQADASRSSMNTQDSRNASLHSLASSGRSPTQSAKTGVTSISGSQPSSGYEYSAPASAGSVASPNGYGALHSFSFQSQAPPNAPSYPTTHYEPRYVGPSWKPAGEPMRADRLSEDLNPGLGGRPSIPYGDSVKRHLDIYDVEASLNEITDLSARTWDFSRRYGIRAHQTQRSGPVLGSLPTLGEVEDMIHMQRRNEEALMRIRAAVVSQEHAMAEQMAQRKALKPGMHEDDHMGMYQEEFKGGGGFAGAESKKRRGKAAPPGRCHSCNRAETPEWRRGPDGARTLCNACGLHYAKLTRKMGASKAPSMGSSLKPKSALDAASPSSH